MLQLFQQRPPTLQREHVRLAGLPHDEFAHFFCTFSLSSGVRTLAGTRKDTSKVGSMLHLRLHCSRYSGLSFWAFSRSTWQACKDWLPALVYRS